MAKEFSPALCIFSNTSLNLGKVPESFKVAHVTPVPKDGPGRVAQSVGPLTRKSGVLGSIPGQHTFVSSSAFSRRAVVSYWRKYVHEVLVNR